HQWWGNMVVPADYRAGWIIEAIANDSALQFIGRTQGRDAVAAVLNGYREDLLSTVNGKPLDAAGPVDFGARLLDTSGMRIWHTITYGKGAWIFHMLRQRLGEDGFTRMQQQLLHDYTTKPLTNDDLRVVASQYVRPGTPDRTLSSFFDTWVYGTGIPKLALNRTKEGWKLDVSGVDEDFTVDVPLTCVSKQQKRQIRWMRASAGDNDVELPVGMDSCALPPLTEFLYS